MERRVSYDVIAWDAGKERVRRFWTLPGDMEVSRSFTVHPKPARCDMWAVRDYVSRAQGKPIFPQIQAFPKCREPALGKVKLFILKIIPKN